MLSYFIVAAMSSEVTDVVPGLPRVRAQRGLRAPAEPARPAGRRERGSDDRCGTLCTVDIRYLTLICNHILDRQKLDDERGAYSTQIASNASLRAQLKAALDELVLREAEINGLQRSAERLAAVRAEEDKQMVDVSRLVPLELPFYSFLQQMLQTVLHSSDPTSLHSLSRPQQMVQLIQINAQLEVKLAALRDPRGLQAKLAQAEEQLGAAQEALRGLQRQYESDIYLMKTEIGVFWKQDCCYSIVA